MARPSQASVQEAERLSRFWRAGMRFLIERGVLAQQLEAAIPSPEQWTRATAGVPFSRALAGMREAAHDTVAMLQDFLEASPAVSTPDVDTALRGQGAPTFSEMRSRKWETLAKVARRRRIATEEEYRLLAEVLSDVGPSGPSEDERTELGELVLAYEGRAR